MIEPVEFIHKNRTIETGRFVDQVIAAVWIVRIGNLSQGFEVVPVRTGAVRRLAGG
jgi:hypothetical protein